MQWRMLEIIPFRSGHRPVDEALGAGQGCSEHVGYIRSGAQDGAADDLWILFRLHLLDEVSSDDTISVRLSASLLEEDAQGTARPLPALTALEIAPQIVTTDEAQSPRLVPSRFSGRGQAYVATVQLDRVLTDGEQFGFAHAFFRRLRVELTLYRNGVPLHSAGTVVEVYDLSRLGTLYDRLRERLLPADTATQARDAGAPFQIGHHPWFPVLAIGTEKARLYLAALRQDLSAQQRHLPDARWLLRVGLYLELLTCLGICEAVRKEHPELLTVQERQQLATSAALASVRRRLKVSAWKRVWALRRIVTDHTGMLSAGPVSLLNLLRKQRATMAFLHAHHNDLREAIALAGPNTRNAQETWLRVFRDAERAVFRKTEQAFPELAALPSALRDFLLWRQAGELPAGLRLVPRRIAALLGDQDGLFPSATQAYRQSMNEVATWARLRGLMEYPGVECVAAEASLLAAQKNGDAERLERLQRNDGYASRDLCAALA